MREAIRTRLVDGVAALSGRVYEPHMGGPDVEKPYAIVKFGGELSTGMSFGYDVPVEVWLYADRTSFNDLDGLMASVVSSLCRVDLTTGGGQTFELRYAGCGDDYYDPEWKALTRKVSLRTERVREG